MSNQTYFGMANLFEYVTQTDKRNVRRYERANDSSRTHI